MQVSMLMTGTSASSSQATDGGQVGGGRSGELTLQFTEGAHLGLDGGAADEAVALGQAAEAAQLQAARHQWLRLLHQCMHRTTWRALTPATCMAL